jgi:flagellum-specific ATP synthase
VLTEGDDQQDPIADSARAILDGHIVLSRSLAESGHYPAIDVEQSISRAMQNITSKAHQKLALKLKLFNSRYNRSVDLINVGAYESGSDATLDKAILKHDAIIQFLQQDISERAEMAESLQALEETLAD